MYIKQNTSMSDPSTTIASTTTSTAAAHFFSNKKKKGKKVFTLNANLLVDTSTSTITQSLPA